MSELSDQDDESQPKEIPKTTGPGFEDYSNMDRKIIPSYEKNLGTEAFKNGDYFEATRHYAKAVMAYQFLIKDGVINDPEEIQKITDEIYLPCNLNLSLCYIKQKEYSMGKDFANKALEVDSNNIKALYRRGICLMNQQEFKAAGQDFKKILELDPNNEDGQQAWDSLLKKREQLKQKEKTMSEKMLNSLDYQDKIQEQKQTKKKNWFIQKFEWVKDLLCVRKRPKPKKD